MKKPLLFVVLAALFLAASGGTVEMTFRFNNPAVSADGNYQAVTFGNTRSGGIPGEPTLPWFAGSLMLPPGETAASVEFLWEDETVLQGRYNLPPRGDVRPLSEPGQGLINKNEEIYRLDRSYPDQATGHLMTQFLDGHGFGMFSFTPVRYNPARQTVSYFARVTVRITTQPGPDAAAALKNQLPGGASGVAGFVLNPDMTALYPQKDAPAVNYDYLIVCPVTFKDEFGPLVTMHADRGRQARVVTTDSISSVTTGYDLPEKIRNFIIAQRQNHGIQYVLLAGNPALVPARGFYCQVNSSGSYYTDSNIPSDLYYAGLDGNFDANGNHVYAEEADNPDLLPELDVARFTVNDTAALHRMIRKTVAYTTNPVPDECGRNLLAGEYLYHDPPTYGGDYMDLLVNDHTDNGYFTHGIPSPGSDIEKLYDTAAWTWSASGILARINTGKSCIHHLGHANTTYMLRLPISSITNANFPLIDGVNHNFQFLYTQGCYDGAFDAGGSGCIAAKAVSIDNFLVAGIFNSRYGWFNQGTTDGPSQHLQREFVSAMYTDTTPTRILGAAHRISKIKTAPWVGLPGEFEPGAQRWCHYCCNAFGDPALEILTEEPTTFTPVTWTGAIDSDWNKPANWNLNRVPTSLCDITIPDSPNHPSITSSGAFRCHNLTIGPGGNLTIGPGKSLTVYGTVVMEPGE